MKISARNQLTGVVKSIKEGVVTAEVVVTLAGGAEIVSVITLDSAQQLELKPGSPVKVVVKSTDVMLGVDD
jgi:molybdate transport system regulatory protein